MRQGVRQNAYCSLQQQGEEINEQAQFQSPRFKVYIHRHLPHVHAYTGKQQILW